MDKQFQRMLELGMFDYFGKRCPLLGKVTLERPSAQVKSKGNLCNAWIRIFRRTSHGLFDHLDDFGWTALNQSGFSLCGVRLSL